MIKKMLCLLYVVVSFNHVPAFAADGWKGPGVITFIQPEIYRQNDVEGSLPVVIGTSIQVPDCNPNSQWVIRTDLDANNRIYSAVLAAFAAGKQVYLHQWSCIKLGGSYYGRIGAVKIY